MLLLPIIRLDTPTSSSSLSQKKKTRSQLTQQSLCLFPPPPLPFACEWQSIVWATFRFWFLSHKYWQAAYASLYIYVCVGVLTSFVSQILFVHLSWCLFIYQNPSMPAMKRLKSAASEVAAIISIYSEIFVMRFSLSLSYFLPTLLKKIFQ